MTLWELFLLVVYQQFKYGVPTGKRTIMHCLSNAAAATLLITTIQKKQEIQDHPNSSSNRQCCYARLNSLSSLAGPRGSVGYIAPGDIYSYGVILLEMLTGKYPTDAMFKDGLNLHKLVENAHPHNLLEILENSLIPCYTVNEGNHHLDDENHAIMGGIQSCVRRLVKLGLKCSAESPKDRPVIQDVYAEIIKIKETFSALCS
ncbi:hypothetical protein ABZP36_009871 [Zizania latifolia]